MTSHLAGLILMLGVLGCRASRGDSSGLFVLYDGCDDRGSVCEAIPGRDLVVWVRAAPGWTISIHAPPTWTTTPEGTALDGERFRMRAAGSGTVTVRARRGADTAEYPLAWRVVEQPTWSRACTQNGTDERYRCLAQFAATTEAKGEIETEMAQLAKRLGDRDPAPHIARAIAAHRANKAKSKLVATLALKIDYDLAHHRYAEARQTAAELPDIHSDAAVARYLSYFAHSDVAAETGALQDAVYWAAKAYRIPFRLGWSKQQIIATDLLARRLRAIGQRETARRLLAPLPAQVTRAKDMSCENQWKVLNNVAWANIRAFDDGHTRSDPRTVLQSILHGRCLASIRANDEDQFLAYRFGLHVSLATANLQWGDPVTARDHLVQADQLTVQPRRHDLLWRHDIEARLAHHEGKLEEAADHYERMGSVAESLLWPTGQWRALLGHARVQADAGQSIEARQTLQRAQGLLDTSYARFGLSFGDDPSRVMQEATTALDLALLFEQGDIALAWESMITTRGRAIRGLRMSECLTKLNPDQRATITGNMQKLRALRDDRLAYRTTARSRPLDEHPRLNNQDGVEQEELFQEARTAFKPLAPCLERPGAQAFTRQIDEVVVAFHPLPHGWLAMARGPDDELTWQRFRPDPDGSTTSAWTGELAPTFAAQIQAASTLTFLPHGPLWRQSLHLLEFEGQPLIARMPVRYRLGLPSLPGHAVQRALVVGDPRNDLPEARAEAHMVARSLSTSTDTIVVDSLIGDQATYSAVLRALARSGRFHFAGHAKTIAHGWGTELILAEGATLSFGDILALEQVPRLVVLLACNSAGDWVGENEGNVFGLARALLARGTQSLVLTTAPISDGAAAAFAKVFYDQLEHHDEATAFRNAQVSLLEANDPDAGAFELISR